MRKMIGLSVGAVIGMAVVLAACVSQPPKPVAGQFADDQAIVAAVRERLSADPVTRDHVIGVRSFRGCVTLSGSVPTEVRARAVSIARQTQGVHMVDDRMNTLTGFEYRSVARP
jgi:osmotically-inducible protein OsmY